MHETPRKMRIFHHDASPVGGPPGQSPSRRQCRQQRAPGSRAGARNLTFAYHRNGKVRKYLEEMAQQLLDIPSVPWRSAAYAPAYIPMIYAAADKSGIYGQTYIDKLTPKRISWG